LHSKRNFGLDLLRAAAIVGVFLSHGVTVLGPLGTGVDLFFVLSGFLIGRIYFRSRRNGSFRLMDFWVARWWRTLPPYLAALGIFALAQYWIRWDPVEWYYIFFLQTIMGLKGFGPSWSLCVEEHFYLALPLLALAAEAIFGPKSWRWTLPVACVFPTLLRVGMFFLVGGVMHMPNQWYRLTPLHCDGLIAGVYLAYLFVEQPVGFQKLRAAAWICAPLALVGVVAAHFYAGTLVFESLYSASLALGFAGWLRLAYDMHWEPQSWLGQLTEKAVRGLALISYSTYLVHTLILFDLHASLESWPRGVLKSTFILTVTLAVCIVFYFLVEKPSIVTRDRFLAARKAA